MINSDHKAVKYHPIIGNFQRLYLTEKFVNLSMRALGILGTSSESFLSMLTDLNFDEKTKKHALLKSMNIAIWCLTTFCVEGTKVGQTLNCLTSESHSSYL